MWISDIFTKFKLPIYFNINVLWTIQILEIINIDFLSKFQFFKQLLSNKIPLLFIFEDRGKNI